MRYRAALLAGLAAVAVAGCGPAHRVGTRMRPGALADARKASARGARADFDPFTFRTVFASAVRAVRERGHDLTACDPDRGALTTDAVEFDAPCGGATCLAREYTAVKLGYRRAKVTLVREVWDTGVRAWREPDDDTSAEAISRDELDLLAEMVRPGGKPTLLTRAAYRAGPPPCVPTCAGGSCLTASAALLR